MERLWIDARAEESCRHAGLDTRAGWLRLMAGPEPAHGAVRVVKRTLPLPAGGALEVFGKHYAHAGPSWRFWGRASKARREFENYALFESLGIRCARRLACLECRDGLGRLQDAFLLTEAVPDTVTLLDYARRAPEARWQKRAQLARQLAGLTRRLHAAGGFHNDLYWRNVLVQARRDGEPFLWWIDCPRGGRARWPWSRRQKQVKDLAALDKDSAGLCHDKERLRFLQCYLGVKKLDADGRALLRRVLAYRARRWKGEVKRET